MADDTASLVQFYARAGAGGSITLEKRVEASWDAACPGQEILHGTQYIGTVADPAALGGTMKGKLDTMDAAAHNYAGELSKDHPDCAVVKDRRETLLAAMGATQVAPDPTFLEATTMRERQTAKASIRRSVCNKRCSVESGGESAG